MEPLEEIKFFTVKQLREILKDLPDDRYIMTQVAAIDGTAWNCYASFCPQINPPDGNIALITLSHAQLKNLPR